LLTIGGTADHVHAFFQLSRTLQVAKLVELIKSNSSRWVKTQGIHNFAWQRGYACFSVGKSQAEAVATYIRNQAEHHRHISYQDEVREFFRRYEVAFDERYVWD
jgi:REP element-mobilizing transposase RayT